MWHVRCAFEGVLIGRSRSEIRRRIDMKNLSMGFSPAVSAAFARRAGSFCARTVSKLMHFPGSARSHKGC